MKALLFATLSLLCFGCAGTSEIHRHQDTNFRRMPQLNTIETGRALTKGAFAASVNVAYSLGDPVPLHVSDSTSQVRKDILGNEVTTITSSDIYCYESRLMMCGEGIYALLVRHL